MSSPPPRIPKFPIIVGPTAGGKSALAVAIAHAVAASSPTLGGSGEGGSVNCGVGGVEGVGGAEILTADAIQIYRGLDIGSAKPTLAEREGIPHHLIDLVDPTERFSVDTWLALAERTIADVRARGNLPVVVGGTHLYVKALLDGLFDGPEPDEALRAALTAMDPHERRREFERVDPAAAARIHPNDVRRTVRALEVFRLTGTPLSEHQQQWDQGRTRHDCLLIGLDWEIEGEGGINRRINARVKQMIERGLVEEARNLHARGVLGVQAREALGYKQLIEHFEGRCSLDDAIEAIKIETRRFAKNQRTWLRRLRTTPGSMWIEGAKLPSGEVVAAILDRLH